MGAPLGLVICLVIALLPTGTGCKGSAIDEDQEADIQAVEKCQIVLSNVNVFDVVDGVMKEGQDILIEGMLIQSVGTIDAPVTELTNIDLSGKFAFPGLFESHTHLSLLAADDEAKMIETLGSFVAKGITQVRDVGGAIDVISQMSERISSGEILGPKIFYSGPMLQGSPVFQKSKNEIQPGFAVAIDSKEDVDRVLPELAQKGACMVKTYNKMDLDVYKHLLAVAKNLGLKPVHDPGRYLFHGIPMDLAIDLGVTSIEHGIAPWPIVLKDNLKREHDRLMAENADEATREILMDKVIELGIESISMEKLQRLIDKVLENRVFVCPTLWVYGWEDIFTEEFIKRKVKILVGHDGVRPELLLNEMQKLRKRGLSELEIIRGATIYPAEWLGVEDRYGSISPGALANLIILDKNPLEDIANFEFPYMVIMNGQVVFTRSN